MKSKNQEKQEKRKSPFPAMEEEVLKFWEEAKTFEKTLEKEAPNGDYIFYDGPPFGTGEPHYGHILSSVSKDVVPRYWTMRGYRVDRKWGWDCHGLPIENIIEQDKNISGKKQIEEMGVACFNEECRSRVLEYADIWDKMVKRIARWVEFKNSYKTMDPSYMESVWWGFKQLWEKDLIYQGRKVLLYCPRCETPISNFEVAMDNSYKDISETSVYVKFRIKNQKNTYILAWTTTPWTLPGNVALAVNKNIKYAVLSIKGEDGLYVVAKERMEEVLKDIEYKIEKEISGQDLVGLEYEPLFDVPALQESGKKVYYVADADFVTTEDGTGVVHTAVVYGEDDYNLGLKLDLPVIPALDEKGHFNETVPEFEGMYFKKANKEIIKKLAEKGLLFKTQDITHSYPHCHRCDTQLFYSAIPSWFMNIQKLKKRMLELNENINWFPKHLKKGRFALGIEQAPDWNISRNRYFATPIPLWECDKCENREVVGSIEELSNKDNSFVKIIFLRHGESEKNILDLHSSAVNKHSLTEKGIKAAEKSAKALKKEKITRIYSSPVLRAKQTAEIVAKELGLDVRVDERLTEINSGAWDEKTFSEVSSLPEWMEYKKTREEERYDIKRGGTGESYKDLHDRMEDFLKTISQAKPGETILIVTHQCPIVHGMKFLNNYSVPRTFALYKDERLNKYSSPLKMYLDTKTGRGVDLHSHFVDDITWSCSKCNGKMKRIEEVFDCWVESGSMPFAQLHYPFENKEKFEKNFPAQYISEYISQTRAWFYVMHVMAVALFDSNSFENVVTTGVILNEKGEKMSKSKMNYPDPWVMINEFGVDALRMYLMSSTIMHAENLFFNERELRDVFRKNIMLLWNVYKFYEMYTDGITNYELRITNLTNVLDQWILARLNQLIGEVTESMNGYDLPRASRPISDFIDDLSTWYLRRSRDRFKGEDEKDKQAALKTTSYVLIELSKVMAPFMPFLAEQIWQRVTGNDFQDKNKSVHLEAWPESRIKNQESRIKILDEMEIVRKIVELGLAERDEAGIKVRQPLSELRIMNYELSNEFLNLIKDEVNVKNVVCKKGKEELKIELETELSDDLKQEGVKREVVRFVNALRKNAKMTIQDRAQIFYTTEDDFTKEAIEKFKDEIMKDTLSVEMKERKSEAVDIKKEVNVNGAKVWLGVKKK